MQIQEKGLLVQGIERFEIWKVQESEIADLYILNVAECNLGKVKCKTMLASGISQGLGARCLGFCAGVPHGLQHGFRCRHSALFCYRYWYRRNKYMYLPFCHRSNIGHSFCTLVMV